jgi:prepilin-type N-terminal cleavage/methylation domain-containing protein
MRRLRLRDEGGFSLIEMIVVVTILGMVLGGITAVFISGSRAQIDVNDRFQAQETARLGLAAIRQDVSSACAAYVKPATTPANSQLTLSIPITNVATNPDTPPDPASQCGTANVTNLTKVFWCVVTSPTNSAKYALYRSSTSCTTSSTSKLVADNLVNTLSGFAGFFVSGASTTVAIPPGQTQTVDVDVPVSLKVGTFGKPYDLKERLALSNTTWTTTSGASCGLSGTDPTCVVGPCPYAYANTLAAAPACYVPVIN